MALVQISSDETGQWQGDIGALPKMAPVVIMLHGYKYRPGGGDDCPHGSLFAAQSHHPTQRSQPWPKRLSIGTARLPALGFGWPARGSLWAAWRQAEIAGAALGEVIAGLRAIAPDRPIHLLGHSLGARVALCALRKSDPGAVNTAILLNAADFNVNAAAALDRHAGTTFQLLNVTSGENALFDLLTELCLLAPAWSARALGRGLTGPNSLTLRLDRPDHRAALARIGFDVPPPDRRICHWSTYLRPGTGALYRALLDGTLRPDHLRRALRDCPPPQEAIGPLPGTSVQA
jgi:pimeloyl-ACP methyl ester carboxylesterase